MPSDPTTDRPVVTRFAPSPTGALHIGGARTALFAWAYARGHNGKFILRLEDTDKKRSSPESTRGIIRDMKWLGLSWDEGPTPDEAADPYTTQLGDNGPYFQSQRAEQGIYDHYIALLLEAGEAYEEDGAVRLKMGSHRGDIAFDDAVYGHIEVKADDLEDFVIRKGDDGGKLPTFHFAVVCDDALMGVTHVIRGQEHLSNTTKHAAIYDALAKLTDDAVMWARPTWVHTPSIMNPGGSKMSKRDKAKAVRKLYQDQAPEIDLNSVIAFFVNELFGSEAPLNLQSPTSIDSSNVFRLRTSIKLAGEGELDQFGSPREAAENSITTFLDGKNDNIVTTYILTMYVQIHHSDWHFRLPEIEVADFNNGGYLQSALLNYIALLGWNPGDNVEKFDLDFLCKHFDFGRIGKANSTFDRDKLRSFNGDAIRELSSKAFMGIMTNYVIHYRPDWHRSESDVVKGDKWVALLAAVQERAETLPQPLDANAFLIAEDDAIAYDFTPKGIRKAMTNSDGAGVKLLEELRAAFDTLPEEKFGHAAHEKINALAETNGINMGKYAQPVRIAVAGSPVTPPLDVTLDLLGKSATLERIDRCLVAAKAHMQAS